MSIADILSDAEQRHDLIEAFLEADEHEGFAAFAQRTPLAIISSLAVPVEEGTEVDPGAHNSAVQQLSEQVYSETITAFVAGVIYAIENEMTKATSAVTEPEGIYITNEAASALLSRLLVEGQGA